MFQALQTLITPNLPPEGASSTLMAIFFWFFLVKCQAEYKKWGFRNETCQQLKNIATLASGWRKTDQHYSSKIHKFNRWHVNHYTFKKWIYKLLIFLIFQLAVSSSSALKKGGNIYYFQAIQVCWGGSSTLSWSSTQKWNSRKRTMENGLWIKMYLELSRISRLRWKCSLHSRNAQ